MIARRSLRRAIAHSGWWKSDPTGMPDSFSVYYEATPPGAVLDSRRGTDPDSRVPRVEKSTSQNADETR